MEKKWWFWSFKEQDWKDGYSDRGPLAKISRYGVTVFSTEEDRDRKRDHMIDMATLMGDWHGEGPSPDSGPEGPRIAEAECDRCGYRQSYYPEDAELPHAWGHVTRKLGRGRSAEYFKDTLCQDCYEMEVWYGQR